MTVSAVSAVHAVGVAGARGTAGALGAFRLAGGAPHTVVRRSDFTITADGSYAACLAEAVRGEGDGGGLVAERWRLTGPEPRAVPLPGPQPEEPGTQLL